METEGLSERPRVSTDQKRTEGLTERPRVSTDQKRTEGLFERRRVSNDQQRTEGLFERPRVSNDQKRTEGLSERPRVFNDQQRTEGLFERPRVFNDQQRTEGLSERPRVFNDQQRTEGLSERPRVFNDQQRTEGLFERPRVSNDQKRTEGLSERPRVLIDIVSEKNITIEHDHVERCLSCIQTRERCSSCRWKCKCGKTMPSKQAFRNHLKHAKKIIPHGKSKKDKTLLSKEYISEIIQKNCCQMHCLQSWTFNEVSSFVRKNANISNAERNKKVVHILELMEKKEENNLHTSKIGGKEFNIVVCGKTICSTSFLSLYGISYNTCKNLVETYIIEKTDDFPENEESIEETSETEVQVTQKDKIIELTKPRRCPRYHW
jgi:hypothetical protein